MVVVIEYNLEVIKTADYIIDMGPEGGELEGAVVVQGAAEKIAAHKNPYTGKYI